MKNRSLSKWISLVTAVTVFGTNDALAESTLLDLAKGQSILTQKMLGKDKATPMYVSQQEESYYRNRNLNLPTAEQTLDYFEKNYQVINRQIREHQRSDYVLNTSKEILGGILTVTGKNPVYEKVGEFIINRAIDANKPILGYYQASLARLINENVEQQYLKQFNGKLDQLALINIQEKYQLNQLIQDKLAQCHSCTPEQRDVLLAGTQKALTAILKGQEMDIDALNDEFNRITGTFEEKIQDIIGVQNRFESFSKDILKNQQELMDGQQLINKGLDEIYQYIKLNADTKSPEEAQKQLRFLKEFITSDAPIKVKRAAIESGIYGNEMKEKKQELLNQMVKFNKSAAAYVGLANDIYNVTQAMGIKLPPKVESFYHKANQAYQTFSAVTNQLASGNYLGAAMSVAGAFNKVKDISSVRHEQIMDALAGISRQLDVVIENQRIIIDYQIRILDGIYKLSEQINEQYQNLSTQVRFARIDIATNRIMLNEGARESLNSCSNLKKKLNEASGGPSLKLINSLLSKQVYAKYFDRCIALSSTLSKIREDKSEDMFPSLISLRANMGNHDEEKTFAEIIDQVTAFKDLYNSLKENDPEFASKVMYLGMATFTDPVPLRLYQETLLDSSGNLEKVRASKLARKEFGELEDKFETYLFNPISTNHLLEVADVVSSVHPLLDIVNNNYEAKITETDSVTGDEQPGKEMLLNTLTYLDIALAQNALYNGQSLIPHVYRKLDQPAVVDALIKVLKKNETFKINFTNYFVANRYFEISGINNFNNILSNQGHPYIRHLNDNFSFLSGNLKPFQSNGVKASVVRNVNQWPMVRLEVNSGNLKNSIDLPLPNLQAGDHDLIEISSNSAELLKMRQQIRNLYESYEMSDLIKKEHGEEAAATWLKMTLLSGQ